MKKYVISSCLLGVNCRYNGESQLKSELVELFHNNQAIPICPEVLGGLKTPREPAEIIANKDGQIVKTIDGIDVTEEFNIGAKSALIMAQLFGADYAILKSCSPSCGSNKIYDGKFQGVLIPGEGITTKLFKKKGIKVYNENNWNK